MKTEYRAALTITENAPEAWAVFKRAQPGARQFNGERVAVCVDEATARRIAAALNAGTAPISEGITEAEEERRALILAAAVGLKARASSEYTGKRYELREGFGTKTALGLFRTVASIIEGA